MVVSCIYREGCYAPAMCEAEECCLQMKPIREVVSDSEHRTPAPTTPQGAHTPTPWRVEEDWTAEIYGADGSLIGKIIYPSKLADAYLLVEAVNSYVTARAEPAPSSGAPRMNTPRLREAAARIESLQRQVALQNAWRDQNRAQFAAMEQRAESAEATARSLGEAYEKLWFIARSAGRKLWTMYKRGECERKSELDSLVEWADKDAISERKRFKALTPPPQGPATPPSPAAKDEK